MKKEYRVVTSLRGKEDEDLCGTFLSMLCLLISKLWGKFDVIFIEKVGFYE